MSQPTTPPTPVPAPRPRPILAAIRSGAWVSVLGTLVTAAVSFGLLDTEQATAVHNIIAAAVTAMTAITAALHTFHVLRTAEPQVTPVVDPQTADGTPLVPSTPPPNSTAA